MDIDDIKNEFLTLVRQTFNRKEIPPVLLATIVDHAPRVQILRDNGAYESLDLVNINPITRMMVLVTASGIAEYLECIAHTTIDRWHN